MQHWHVTINCMFTLTDKGLSFMAIIDNILQLALVLLPFSEI